MLHTEEIHDHHTYTVGGLTCGHCVAAVTHEVAALLGPFG